MKKKSDKATGKPIELQARNAGKPTPASITHGPEPERLKIEGNWVDAVDKALTKKRPPQGWPKK